MALSFPAARHPRAPPPGPSPTRLPIFLRVFVIFKCARTSPSVPRRTLTRDRLNDVLPLLLFQRSDVYVDVKRKAFAQPNLEWIVCFPSIDLAA